MAIEYFVKIAPAVASVGGEGSMCRMVFYHNKAAAGAVPDVAQIFDTNNFYSGRNVNYATKFSLLDDITHQMVITSYNPAVELHSARSRAVQDHPGDPSNCGTVWRKCWHNLRFAS